MSNQHDTEYDPAICERVPELFRKGRSIAQVASKLGIARSTFYKWREDHEEFDKACNKGETLAEAKLERLAMKGVLGEIKNFNAPMMIFLMKNRFRKSYGDQKDDKSAGDSLLEQLLSGKVKIVENK